MAARHGINRPNVITDKIKEIVFEIKRAMGDKIEAAKLAGLSSIEYEISETQLIINNTKAIDMEIIIISELIVELEKDRNEVLYDPLNYIFVIKFPSIFSEAEINRRKKIIAEHLIKTK